MIAHIGSGYSRRLFAFVHIEKTAGSTLSSILMRHYGPRAFLSVGSRKDRAAAVEALRAAGENEEARGVRGNVPFGVMRRWLPADTRYVTLLRDPRERTLSHFFYLDAARERALPDWAFKLLPAEGATLRETLDRPRVLADNLHVRMLSSDPDAWRRWRSPVGAETLEDAKRTLRERMAAFGLTERFDDSLAAILPFLGVEVPPGYVDEKVAEHPRFDDLDAADRRAVEAHNVLDLELYAYAAGLFEERHGR